MQIDKRAKVLYGKAAMMDDILSLHPDFMYLFGLDRRFLFSNKSLLDLLGIKLEEIVGKNFWDLGYPPELAAKLDQEIARALTGETVRAETEYVNHEGKAGFYEYIFVPVRNSRGEISAVSGTTRDFTERKRSEAELFRLRKMSDHAMQIAGTERERLASLFEQAPFALAFLDGPEHRYVFTNKSYANLLLGGKNVLGKTVGEAQPETAGQGFIDILNDVYRSGKRFVGSEIPVRLSQGNGEEKNFILNFSYEPMRNAAGDIDGILVVSSDVTEQAKARATMANTAEAIANERQNFRNLFRQTPEMVCITSGPEHTFEFVNQSHIKALGFDATGQTVRQAQPESVEVHGILDQVYRTGETAELREIPVTLTDRVRYFNLTYAASRDLAGDINGITIIGAEVTEQVLTRELLRTQNRALEMMLAGDEFEPVLNLLAKTVEQHLGRGALASVMLLDGQGKHLLHGAAPSLPSAYNEAVNAIPVGPKVGSCGTAAYIGREVVVESIANDPLWEGFQELAAANGLRSCWSTPLRSSRGALMGTFALYNFSPAKRSGADQQVIDLILHTAALVVERQLEAREKLEAEAALRKSERLFRRSQEKLRLAVDVAKVGFYDWNIPENTITFSRQMMEDWGVTGESGRKIEDALNFIHPEDRDRVGTLIQETMDKDLPYHTEYRVLRPDGKVTWMDVRGQVHRDDYGRPVRFFGTAVAIDEQKGKEESLREAQVLAESANAAKGMFLANMSHEIRTPLGAIMGFLDLLKNPKISRDELSDFIGVIDRNSQQLLQIVDDVLDLSKIESGKFLVENISFSLIELLTDFTSLMAFKARDKGLLYELHLDGSIPEHALGDPTRLRQILNNVVGNAIKFTERGSVALSVRFAKGMLEISVKDTGIGISPETSKRLFQPFSQADNSTTRNFGGTGLGLTLTRRLSQALGGNFTLERSEPGKGSTFVASVRLEIPAGTEMRGSASLDFVSKTAEFRSGDESVLSGLQVLVVDDSPDNQALMKILLKRWSARFEVAENGKEAFERATNGRFDVILMDVQMPVMDSHEATKRLRGAGFEKPIIALTAHAMQEERERCLKSGFSGFLSKPINKDALLEQLRAVGGNSGAVAASVTASILLVEDDIDTRSLIEQMLVDQGYTVHAAASGAAAMDKISSIPPPNLILLDLSLPDMKGEDLLKQLDSLPGRSKSRVLVCSGWDKLPEKAKAMGANGSIRKPYDIVDFLDKVAGALSASSAEV